MTWIVYIWGWNRRVFEVAEFTKETNAYMFHKNPWGKQDRRVRKENVLAHLADKQMAYDMKSRLDTVAQAFRTKEIKARLEFDEDVEKLCKEFDQYTIATSPTP